MNKDNKKAAQARRAEERKKQEKKKLLKNICIVVVIVAVVAGLIGFGVWDNKKSASKEASEQATTETGTNAATAEDTSSDNSLDTDTSRAVENGDVCAIDYKGTVDGIAFAGGTGSYDLEIGSGSFIDGFEDQLIGHKIGETFDIQVTFTQGYGGSYQDANGEDHSLSGVDATFTVTINGIYNK